VIKRLSALLTLVVASLALAAGAAFAQTTPSEDVYGGQGEQIEETAGATQGTGTGTGSDSGPGSTSNPGSTQTSVPAGENSSSDSALPFTGSDLGTALLVGFVLLGAGLLVRRGARANPTH
jgi:hypothetical protein